MKDKEKLQSTKIAELDEEAYKELLAAKEELAKLKANGNGTAKVVTAEEHENKVKALEEQVKTFENAQQSAARKELRAIGLAHLESLAGEMNKKHFDSIIEPEKLGKIVSSVAESFDDKTIDGYIRDKVDGVVDYKSALKPRLHEAMKEKAEEYNAIAKRFREASVMQVAKKESGQEWFIPDINALSEGRRELGNRGERAYWSDEKRQDSGHNLQTQIEMMILEQAFRKPMINPKTKQSWVVEHMNILHPDPDLPSIRDLQRRHIMGAGHTENDMMAPRGLFYQMFMQEEFKARIARMFAEDTMTSAGVIGTGIANLPVDYSSLVVLASWPNLIAKRIAARTGTMPTGRKRLFEITIPRGITNADMTNASRHWVGAVDSDTPATLDTSKTLADGTVVADAGTLVSVANASPAELWAYLGEAVVGGTTTITVTATTPTAGVSSTASVTFLTTDAVGTRKRFTEGGLLGDRYVDVTAVASTGWTDAAGNGEVGIYFARPWRGHTAGAAADQIDFTIDKTDVTETIYDKQANLTQALMEDLMNAVSEGSLDGPALVLNLLRRGLNQAIDGRLFYQFITQTYTGNQRTFLPNTPPAEYSPQSWKSRLKFYQSDMFDYVLRNSGQRPNRAIWNTYDKTAYMDWLTWNQGDLHALSVEANDPFRDGQAQFQLDGADIYISENMPTEYIGGCGTEMFGVHSYDYIPLKVLQGQNAAAAFEQVIMIHHRGYHGVPSTDMIQAGRAIGTLRVVRR